MKTLCLVLGVVAMLVLSPLTHSATYQKIYATTQNGTYLGNEVYYVKLHNTTHRKYLCRVMATNRANYLVYVYPKSSSRWMRINDINALYKWKCVPQ